MKTEHREIAIAWSSRVAFAIGLVYFVSMFIIPAFKSGFDWQHVQNVWDRWQALNVGMLAFISSIVAFSIPRYIEHERKERDFIAARAFLPEALSELTSYFKASAVLLKEAWEKKEQRPRKPLDSQCPSLPALYKEVFGNCIRNVPPDVRDYLAQILVNLQIHHARMSGLFELFLQERGQILIPENIITYLYRLGELHALCGRLFEYSRGWEDFNGSSLSEDDIQNAYGNLDIFPEQYGDLIGFTKRRVLRASNEIDRT